MVIEENKKQNGNISNNSSSNGEKINQKNNPKNKKSNNKNVSKNNSQKINNKNNNTNKTNNLHNEQNNNQNKHQNKNTKNTNNKKEISSNNIINSTEQSKDIKSENILTNEDNSNKNHSENNVDLNINKTKEKNTKVTDATIILDNPKEFIKEQKNIDSVLEKRDITKEKISIKKEIIEEETSKKDENNATIVNKKEKKSKPVIRIALIFIIVFFIILISIFSVFTFLNNNASIIAKGIYIDGIEVSRMTKDDARLKLEEYYTEKLSHDITLTHGEYETYIKPNEIDLKYDINSAVNYAFKIGKSGNIFGDNYEIFSAMLNGVDITPTYTYNKDTLKNTLDNFSKELPDHVVESTYYIEDNNVIITLGSAGKTVDSENTIPLIENTFKDVSFIDKKLELITISKEPEKIDINKIHSEVYKEAKDAYYTTDPYIVYPSENGLDFKISIEEAENLVSNASENEITIPLKVLYPNVTTNMIGVEAFPDLLGTFSTKYVSNKDRTTNLTLAAKKINGTVLLPGETFSYNTVVGERTIAAGYKSAAVYENGQVVQGLGGGICQISTTLFNAVLFANLEIVELHNHQFVPSYVTAGRDATVVYGVKDFKFKNTRNHAIKIECSVSGGIAKFNIWGVKEPDEYDVSVYAQVTSKTSSYIKSSTYRTLKQNGEVVKNEKIASYTYKVH